MKFTLFSLALISTVPVILAAPADAPNSPNSLKIGPVNVAVPPKTSFDVNGDSQKQAFNVIANLTSNLLVKIDKLASMSGLDLSDVVVLPCTPLPAYNPDRPSPVRVQKRKEPHWVETTQEIVDDISAAFHFLQVIVDSV